MINPPEFLSPIDLPRVWEVFFNELNNAFPWLFRINGDKTMQKIGVLIPYLNCEQYVEELVLSLASKHPLSIFIINNGSKKSIVDSMSDEVLVGDVQYLESTSNMGVASAWNRGIRYLFTDEKIDKVLVLNNDILLHPSAIEELATAMDGHPHPVITATDVASQCAVPQDVRGLPVPSKRYFTDEPEFSCFMISREGYELIGEFDPKFHPAYFEDNDYHYRAKLLHKRMVKLNTALYYHYGSRTIKENADVADTVNTFYLQNERYYVTKWGGKPGEEKYTIPFNGKKHE